MSEEFMAHMAKPGDPDLDLDVDGLTLINYFREATEFIVNFEGGFGFWIVNGRKVEFEPGSETAHVNNSEMTFGFRDDEKGLEIADKYAEYLDKWWAQATPLRLTAAPDKWTILQEDHDGWLAIPRT